MGNKNMGFDGPIEYSLEADESDKELARFRLDTFKPSGFFSFQVNQSTAQTGTTTFEYEITNHPDKNVPEAAWFSTGISALLTDQNGGWGFKQFPEALEPIFAKQLRIIGSETTGTAGTGTTGVMYPNIQ